MPPPLRLEPVVYRVDRRDTIVLVNAAWDRFAIDNGAPELAGSRVIARPIWDFISDPATSNFYHALLVRARRRLDVSFSLRCDAPALRRYLRMRMIGGPDDEVEFETTIERVEPRAAAYWPADSGPAPGDALVRMCSWCRRVYVHGAWMDIEEAVDRLGLFERHGGNVTHSICESCIDSVTAVLGK